jgi:CubicO group peptidase (beta-lactamase class C family)
MQTEDENCRDQEFTMNASKVTCILLILAIALAGCTSPKSVSVPVPGPEYWPTEEWQSTSPEAQGMDSNLLAYMLEDISKSETGIHSILVIRNGYLVTEAYFHPYTRDTKMQIQSITKSVIGALVGIAIRKGYIQSANEKLLSFFPKRMIENPGPNKDAIRLKHLLSNSSGFPCQEFSSTGQSMEQSSGWVQYMLDLPVETPPGKTFGYCDGNPHLLSAILQNTTGMDTREFANQELFRPLGIPAVEEADWWTDPQGIPNGGYGLSLRPVDLAKIAFLYLQNGKWEGQQILPAKWAADSTIQYVQKPEGPGYGYLWTVYPGRGRYSALGLGGQQIHVYPSQNLVVIVTASLESFVEAPEIENLLDAYILPAVQANESLVENAAGYSRLQAATELAVNPLQPVPALPPIAEDISGSTYTFEENPMGWETMEFVFEPGTSIAKVNFNGEPLQVGLDNIYRLSSFSQGGDVLLRGRWEEDIFVLDYPYSLTDATRLGGLGESKIRSKFTGDTLEVTAQQLVFGGEPIVLIGSR